ncbi:hypothetical protein ElyMa_003146700 [Elysia marginata]|uniref:Uncharacterized protein n=1 Tax=Elysia marginata TaxID=1093978 RepID=A0AAV4IV39_9GAST|nr:hypothetical protein ElyMa_003146700 [Elysia marginata]
MPSSKLIKSTLLTTNAAIKEDFNLEPANPDSTPTEAHNAIDSAGLNLNKYLGEDLARRNGSLPADELWKIISVMCLNSYPLDSEVQFVLKGGSLL